MELTRRRFLQSSSLLLSAAALPSASWADKPAPLPVVPRFARPNAWPIVQGMTDATSASFVILHPRAARFTAQAERASLAVIERDEVPGVDLATTEILVTGLRPGIDFKLNLIDDRGRVFDQRLFRALDLSRPGCRFAVASCMNDSYDQSAITMWEAMALERPDFVVFLGDTVYGDQDNRSRDEKGYGRRYAEVRQRLAWFRLPRLIPSFATWDDHDFGLNNADRTFRMASVTRRLFRGFWGTRFNGACRRGFGVGSVFEAFGQRFFMMDDRSFRDPEGSKGGRHWGREQTDWLIAELNRSKRPAWLMNGSQFFGAYLGKESFEADHPGDFDDVLKSLARTAAPVCFVSGDVHFSEIMEIEPQKMGYKSYEFTSSAMHSFTAPFQQHRAHNPRRMVSTWRHNFMVFDVDVRQGWNIQCRSVLEGNTVSFSENLSIRR